MKQSLLITIIAILTIICCFELSAQQGVSINSTGAAADNSALLDLTSTNKGTLITRMNTIQRNSITSPAEALLIYNTSTQCYEGYNASLSQWVSFGCIGCQLPGSFAAVSASNIAQTSFTANWNISSGALTYYLDVATDAGFTGFVPGYNNVNVGNYLSYNVTGLICNTTYYYRVRAGNSCGTGANSNNITLATSSCDPCGGSNSMTDTRDSKVYNIVSIGLQCWMAQNLNYSTSGTYVSGATEQTNNSIIEKYCFMDNTSNCNTYGGLYQWAEVVQYYNGATNSSSWSSPPTGNLQGVCPPGWHVPTDPEWCTMENTVEAGTNPGCSGTEWLGLNTGNKMKTFGNGSPPLWMNPSAGTNASGFSAMGGGARFPDHSFGGLCDYGVWWVTSEGDATNAWRQYLKYNHSDVNRAIDLKPSGFSVRCVKN